MLNKDITNILIVGMGGQGVISAARVLGTALVHEGYDVKTTEVHGMAQRGGSVDAHLRFGPKVYSPMIPVRQADILVALEELEAIRFAHYLRPGGLLLLYPERRIPASLDRDMENLPKKEVLDGQEFSLEIIQDVILKRQPNILMLGRLSMELAVSESNWRKSLEKVLKPAAFEMALKDFLKGRNISKKGLAVTA